MGPSIEEIQEVLKIFLDSELQDLRLEIGNVRLAVSKGGGGGLSAQPFSSPSPAPAAVPPAAAPAPAAASDAPVAAPDAPTAASTVAAAPQENWVPVTAPSVGVFYRRPAPDQPPFVEVGKEVAEGDPLCLIEVMKMYTSVVAPCRGRVAQIPIEDATVVEYGQPLMYIEPV